MNPYNVEAAIVAWLNALGYPCAQLMQRDRAGVFVTATRQGGGVEDFRQAATFSIQVWADTNAQASEAAAALAGDLVTQTPPAGVHSVEVAAGPYPWADYETGRARYQIVADAYAQLFE